MKTRRVLVSVLASCALLAQSWAIAGMGPVMAAKASAAAPAATTAMPCHGDATQEQAPSADAGMAGTCCDDAGTCAKVCAGGTGMVPDPLQPAAAPVAGPVLAATASRLVAAHTLTPLRPPIPSQS